MKFTKEEIGDLFGYEVKVITHRLDELSGGNRLEVIEFILNQLMEHHYRLLEEKNGRS